MRERESARTLIKNKRKKEIWLIQQRKKTEAKKNALLFLFFSCENLVCIDFLFNK
jgi:hypothetical protein